MIFEAGQLADVVVDAASWAAAWQSLNDKYGPPDTQTLKEKGHWFFLQRSNAGWARTPLRDGARKETDATWNMTGGQIELFLARGQAVVSYWSARGQHLQGQNY